MRAVPAVAGWCAFVAALLMGGPAADAASFTVNNLGDSGTGSLRSAIALANSSTGLDTIAFSVSGTIHLVSQLPALSDSTGGTLISGGSNITIDGSALATSDVGFLITTAGNGLDGLSIVNCPASGVRISGAAATANTISACTIGTDGTSAFGNQIGVLVDTGASNNRIGGLTAATRNVISGNNQAGVLLSGPNTSSNGVEGNYIGLNAAGLAPLSNGAAGVQISSGASSNIIGGLPVGAGNVISGNTSYGILIQDSTTASNVIQANFIGTNAAGTGAVGNGADGVGVFFAATGNTIGGTVAGAGNVISGNLGNGVSLGGIATNANFVQRNTIGLNAAGNSALANSGSGVVLMNSASNNTIGGSVGGAGNTISGNSNAGIVLQNAGTLSNVIAGNFIGTDPSGTTAIGNAKGIMVLSGTPANKIGGSSSTERNIISGNQFDGVYITGPGTAGIILEGNYIGASVTGTQSIPNGEFGVEITGGATTCAVGATAAGSGNLISGNGAQGIQIDGTGTTGNVLQGNFIGVDITGAGVLPNAADGVKISGAASSNTIGGTAAGSANVISGNLSNGVLISDAGTTGNFVEGNFIGVDGIGATALGNTHAGVNISLGASSNTVGGAGAANIISGNATGVFLYDSGTTGNVIVNNLVGTNADGTAALGNGTGVLIGNQAAGNTIGGPTAADRNLISGNTGLGVQLSDGGTSANVVLGNAIGTNWTLTAPLGNGGPGVMVNNGATADTVGGPGAGDGNVVAFNVGPGVKVTDAGSRVITLRGNSIHDNAGGGILLENGANDGVPKPTISGLIPVNGAGPANATVEVFVDAGDQGKQLVATLTASADGLFSDASLDLTPHLGKNLTVTATDTSGNTTEFSLPLTIDLTAPTVQAITPSGSNPTNLPSVDYTVTFTEPVTGVDATDFALNTLLSGATISGVVDNGGDTYTVTVDTGTGDGPLRLDLVDDDSIADLSLNPLGGLGTGDGSFIGPVYMLDRTPPDVSLSSLASETTRVSPIPVTVAFTEPVTDFTGANVSVTNATVSNFSGSGANYTFDLVPSGQGTVSADIPAGVSHDLAGNGNTAAATLSRTYDSVAPTVSVVSATLDPTNLSPVPVIVTFSEPVTGFTLTDLIVSNATASNFSGSNANYVFDLVPTTAGPVSVSISAGAANDAAGNLSVAAALFTRTYDPSPVTGSLAGVVQDFVTGARLGCAAIRVYSAGASEERIVTVDLNGAYQVSNLPVGDYTVESFAPGYVDAVATAAILQGAQRTVNFGLHTGTDSGGVRGVVTDAATHLPLLGVRVDAVIGGTVVATTYSCADGNYELTNLVAKSDTTVTVECSDPNYQTTSQDTQVSSGTTSTVRHHEHRKRKSARRRARSVERRSESVGDVGSLRSLRVPGSPRGDVHGGCQRDRV
ncbi:MAG: right-handed parallel beta-helix repeat-containing protein [Candidatus Hydrogenedentes bacterium]|nr:right-handed parallel beta-helix repeat-containing protein [Candidatus Hydrogenedentota bacterium]